MIKFKKNKKILIIGAGSGRDMASAVLITEKYKFYKNHIDLAGFLTPWALHTFNNALEKPINSLLNKTAAKFMANSKNEKLNSFFEPELLSLNKHLDLGIKNFYLFSLQYGIKKLKKELERLITANSYDLIVIVDVGGDILARKKDFADLFTPIVDFSCLELFSGINQNIEKQIVVIAPGVDGELSEKRLVEIFKEYDRQGISFQTELLNFQDKSCQKFLSVFKEINKKTKSTSQTAAIIKKIAEKKIHFKSNIEYKKILNIKNKKWIITFPVKLKSDIAGKIFYFNFNDIRKLNNITVKYNNITEAFFQFKNMGAGGTEIDLTYVPRKIHNGKYEGCLFILNIFSRVNAGKKKEIMDYILSQEKKNKINNIIRVKDF